jgi:antitoxin component of RelBE/YafQ-DinJ toxin-antitoxin module
MMGDTYRLRVTVRLKRRFLQRCRKLGLDASFVIRDFMRACVERDTATIGAYNDTFAGVGCHA